MGTYISIERVTYEEPYHLNLIMWASNGRVTGGLEFYVNAREILEWAVAMERFPLHAQSVELWEIGSEYPEDRFSVYFRMRLFTVDGLGHCALQFRFNNNEALPDREISEFCIPAEAAQINRLGQLLRGFAELKHLVLHWSPSGGGLYESREEARLALAGY